MILLLQPLDDTGLQRQREAAGKSSPCPEGPPLSGQSGAALAHECMGDSSRPEHAQDAAWQPLERLQNDFAAQGSKLPQQEMAPAGKCTTHVLIKLGWHCT